MPSILIDDFGTWRPGYGLSTVSIYIAGTNTLADVFTDEDLTLTASNPQTLAERVNTDGISYGRFQVPLYVGVPYELGINSVDRTGVRRPALTTLEGADASLALVTAADGSQANKLEDHLSRRIDVRDYGDFKAVGDTGASRATNTATLTAAIGVAGGRGGARVLLPAGTYQLAAFTIPAGVVLEGEERDATILQSNQGGAVCTIGGDAAGLARLTLDGVTQVVNSIGVSATNHNRIVLDDVVVKRFETGIKRDGGKYSHWRDLTVSDCVTGAKDYATTAELSSNRWEGGGAELCSTIGLDARYDGQAFADNVYTGLVFDTNTGIAARLEGVKESALRECVWTGNTTNLTVLDDSATNQVVGLEITDGAMNTGALSFTGRLENVALRRMTLTNLDVTITTPTFAMLIEDSEESGVAISGAFYAWLRHETGEIGATFGETTGNSATKAWAITLNPGDVTYLEAVVIARQINSVNRAIYNFVASAYRAGSTLDYDTQTGNFTKGHTLTGATSGATATIQSDADSGSTGTLTLLDITGAFVDNEIITDGAGGSATANGALVAVNATISSGPTDLFTPDETNAAWAAAFVANGPEIELRVTGASSATVEWTVKVKVSRNY